MPEVTTQRDPAKLSPIEKLRTHVRDEADLAEFHERRAMEAWQRRRDYLQELVKLGGSEVATGA